MKRRLVVTTGLGAILGIFCIIGVGARIGFEGNEVFLIAMWYNRVIMGLMIGFAGNWMLIESPGQNSLLRGAFLGFLVTSAILLTSDFRDLPSFAAGILYGIIIDGLATQYVTE